MFKIPYCFTKKDLMINFNNKSQFDNWIKKQSKRESIKKIRNGLYVAVDTMGVINATKYEIGSKATNDAVICYHSALEYYGLTNQVYNYVIVGSLNRFNSFEFEGIDYYYKKYNNYNQVLFNEINGIRVTSLEKTIVDCIDDIDYAGGIEELLNAIDMIDKLDEQKLLEALASYDEVLLYQKTGYILEQFNDSLRLSDDFFNKCIKKMTNQIKYFLNDEYNDVVYNSKWKLMAPYNLKTRINGGL